MACPSMGLVGFLRRHRNPAKAGSAPHRHGPPPQLGAARAGSLGRGALEPLGPASQRQPGRLLNRKGWTAADCAYRTNYWAPVPGPASCAAGTNTPKERRSPARTTAPVPSSASAAAIGRRGLNLPAGRHHRSIAGPGANKAAWRPGRRPRTGASGGVLSLRRWTPDRSSMAEIGNHRQEVMPKKNRRHICGSVLRFAGLQRRSDNTAADLTDRHNCCNNLHLPD